MAERFKRLGALYVPSTCPEQIGVGCPRCDDHELIPYATGHGDFQAAISGFMKRHAPCGDLESIEILNGRLRVTGIFEKSTLVA